MTAPDAPPIGEPYMRFTLDHDEQDAARRFEQRYGQPPDFIFPYLIDLCVGPVPEREGRQNAHGDEFSSSS